MTNFEKYYLIEEKLFSFLKGTYQRKTGQALVFYLYLHTLNFFQYCTFICQSFRIYGFLLLNHSSHGQGIFWLVGDERSLDDILIIQIENRKRIRFNRSP